MPEVQAHRRARGVPIKKTLGEILEEQKRNRAEERGKDVCPSCQERIVDFWGLPMCSETRPQSQAVVDHCLSWYKAQGIELIADALDLLDLEALELMKAGRIKTPDDDRLALPTLTRVVLQVFLLKGMKGLADVEVTFRSSGSVPPGVA
jgi:hypothetical protein